ncbi:MAG: hypothetical protein ABIK27_08940 [Bacteroidota bacterium]
MKNILTVIVVTAAIIFSGCQFNMMVPDTNPPNAPRGLYAVARDNRVNLYWNHNYERDLAGYRVYVSSSYDGRYQYIGSTQNDYFIDKGVTNGKTYYYAVSAYDYDGNESDLSRDETFATPRPEGYGTTLNDYRTRPSTAGYDFSTYSIGYYDDQYTDIFYEYYAGVHYMNVWNDTDIKDMGYTNSLFDIEIAPSSGWSTTKDVVLAVGKTYVVWTFDDRYAKFRVVSLSPSRVVFDWTYQLQKGNPYLKRTMNDSPREFKFGPGAETRK